jgi:beta-glucosidase
VEGAVDEDGRGPSIWDTFCRIPGNVRGGDTGDVACDQYHRYPQDIALMAELGVGAYRFSVAWPRVQPEGHGPANPAGLDHYRRLVDELDRHGIEPVPTLYHWDLPQALEDAGGWPNRDTAERFAEYAAIVHRALSGGVAHWVTVNEPWVAAWLGYGTGVHAPGRTDDGLALAAGHHLLLAHALARDAIGEPVGIALNLEPHRPASEAPRDAEVAHLADLHMNALFLDPLFGRGYPSALVERYRALFDRGFVREGDLGRIAGPLSFLGVNYYRPHAITTDPDRSDRTTEIPGSLGGWDVVPRGTPVTSMGWPIEPSGPDGVVHDEPRIAFLRDHVAAAGRALAAGVPLIGHLVWSLLDNFEWAEGYAKRFGLVHVDFETQVRTPKASARWLKGLVESGSSRPV